MLFIKKFKKTITYYILFSDIALLSFRIKVFVCTFVWIIISFLSFTLNSSQISIWFSFLIWISIIVSSVSWFILVVKILNKNNWESINILNFITDLPVFFTLSFLALIKSYRFPYSSFSMLLNVCITPFFSSISKSNDLLLPPPLAKFTLEISSNLICIGGLWMNIKPLSRG